MNLIQNALYIPEDDMYLCSKSVHDFVTYVLRDNKELSIDGGTAYLRRAGDFINLEHANRYEEWNLTDEDGDDLINSRLLWGVRGINGDEPFRYRPIKEFTTDHLRAILANVPDINPIHRRVVEYWLDFKTQS